MAGKKWSEAPNNYQMLKRSWRVQGKLFFEHSTLHGVRYIAETGRPFIERFMWFTCVAMGAIATTVIIFNLWEKFQTNPTITGLDTDFHNWDVAFPGITVCQMTPTSNQVIENYLQEHFQRNGSDSELDFFMDLCRLSLDTLTDFTKKYSSQKYVDSKTDLKQLVLKLTYKCDEVFDKCFWKSYPYNCCNGFFPVFTENGFCYTFNSRHYEKKIPGKENGEDLPEFRMQYIRETDIKWSMKFKVKEMDSHFSIYILNSDEVAGIDTQPQHIWDFRMETIKFSVKQTYTTEDTAQLSIKQRHCAFPDEIKLMGEEIYSYTACTRECRMKNAMKLCSCVPFFYPIGTTGYVHCNIDELACIAKHLEEIKSVDSCSCYLGCSNTVYEVEKLDTLGSSQDAEEGALDCTFVSWPMVRYKREVLFGWVDLLVSFGGIAGLFLGFSLLSGVQILYYFTIRACCMVMKENKQLNKIRLQEKLALPPKYDSSLVPYLTSKTPTFNDIGINFQSEKFSEFSKILGPFNNIRQSKPSSTRIKPPYGIEFIN